MRRKYLVAAVFSLPLANALSLASFQQITSGLIPAACATAYTSQIASCDANDFNKGCSSDCVKSLRKTEEQVEKACFGLIVNAKSLLGIVQAGGIVEALCVKGEKDASSTTKTTTTRPAQTTTTRAVLTSDTASRTSGRTTTTQTTTTTSISAENNVVTPTTSAPAEGLGPIATSSSRSRAPTTTQRADANTGDRSGGGSPFDIVNANGGSHFERRSTISALVLGGWALMMAFGR